MKNTLIIIIFLFIANCLSGQVNFGLNTSFVLPTNNYDEVDYGLGGNLLLGYSFKQRFDIKIIAGNIWMNSFIENYKINSYELSANYYFIDKVIRPYIGFGGGYYIKSFDDAFNIEKYYEKGLGIKPQIGCSFNLINLKGLRINTQFYYNKVFTEHQINLVGLNIGLLYHFERN
jgi:outer membrane protein W